ncbi:MAG: UMP kinase [Candidatus Ryanbacteria bacterium RIFCSPHIGHO2_02_FULL_48_12]|uniref:Uridylate kinase n=1 Tax=Candidatus Ryanbacteria bacterium RIFCSPHIGHO2_01_FULL_48_27 TaxID=1802115 RepID=A0A1G2G503_9BACT|nr:MAG: UMP kinase [Candidatus Ryanbacteria bacterium RIFCSPHIGHO2_01_FULL_48_27]OGZ49064.1 MAG: UMP kinase [Candidatus Ryanbacteria bacterium RIFCSPHIGHO2_02_FULL_48_12]
MTIKKRVASLKKKLQYKRIILKLTGEAFAGTDEILKVSAVEFIAREIKTIVDLGVEVGVVVGGGNIVRGARLSGEGGVERVTADHMGMLATAINALLLGSVLEAHGVPARVETAIEMRQIAEPFIRKRALKHLSLGRVVIFSCGTGNPNFSTDTAAVLRASEVRADAIFKATKVDGVFTSDPVKDKRAVLIPNISYDEAFAKRLKFMDAAAIGFAMESYPKPIHVFNIFTPNNLKRVVLGEQVGSKIG